MWTLPASRSKNGKPHVIPLSAQMQTLLRAQPRFERKRSCISGGARRLFGLEQVQGSPRSTERRVRLDAPRCPPHGRHGPAETWRPA